MAGYQSYQSSNDNGNSDKRFNDAGSDIGGRSTSAQSTAQRRPKDQICVSIKNRVVEFFRNAYNEEKGEILGRSPIGWGLLLAFYICFYIGLALFYSALWFLWTEIIINRDSPLYSGPDDGFAWTPGVSFMPILDPERKSTLLRFTRSNDTQIAEIKDLMYYSFLESYEAKYWTSENGNFIDCKQGRTDPDPEKVCEYDLDNIVPCIYQDDYGWADGEPCIILKLNRINDWVPENYENIDEVPEEIRDVWEPNFVTVKCYGEDPVTREHLTLNNVQYYPRPGWSFDYYPFTGQQGYKSPLVAVQFFNLPQRTLMFITCKAYSKNMIYEPMYGLGMVRFEMISD